MVAFIVKTCKNEWMDGSLGGHVSWMGGCMAGQHKS